MEMPQFCLELARLAGAEIRQNTWLDESGHWGRPINELCSLLDTIDLDRSQFLRLPADFSGRPSWRIIKYLCKVANQSESFYTSISGGQWLRTVIVSPKPAEIFSSEQDDSNSILTIHSNVVPGEAYLKAVCLGHQHCRGFFPAHVITSFEDELGVPLPHCEKCALAEQLRTRTSIAVDKLDTVLKFWFLEVEEVELVEDLGEGNEGAVSKILWRKGVFARKRFNCEGIQQNGNMNRELDVALGVSHPNIVHCFGCSSRADSDDCDLFMELLEVDLHRFLVEGGEADSESPFSFRESLDVLLQVAQAMNHMHERNFVHGDLKPQNIFMSCFELAHSRAQYYLVKVGDFGCAQRVDCSGATVEPFHPDIGTLCYTAPEVLRCRRKYGGAPPPEHPQKMDVYSFGVVAYQVLTGVIILYEGCKTSRIAEEVIQGRLRPDFGFKGTSDGHCLSLLPLIRSCWTQNPEERPSFSQICAELDRHLFEHDQVLRGKHAKRKHQSVGEVNDCIEQRRFQGNMLLGVG